ncbi:MAG TPA: glycosyltransferase 87 family protein [Thermoleophilaceae bacterium]|jgi:hypothetical protein|nr:glycosyltransferase 87 family protein [Thermoleophilaceae bacterium]
MVRAGAIAAFVVVLGFAAHYATGATLGLNYSGSGLDADRTGDAVQALAELDFDRFFATQPPIGPGSVIARAPFAALARLGGPLREVPPSLRSAPGWQLPGPVFDSQLRLYRWGVFACLAALAFLAAAAAWLTALRGGNVFTQVAVGVLAAGIPLWTNAIRFGHPDEFFTTAVTLLAVVAAARRRPTLAAVLIGFALASKQWAVLALPAVLYLARPAPMLRTFAIVAGTYLLLIVPMAIGDPGRFWDALQHPAGAHGLVDARSLWFRLSQVHDVRAFDGVQTVVLPRRTLPHALESAIHPLIVILALGLSVAYLRRPGVDLAGVFRLLALIFLLRCVLDPVTNLYYHAPFIAALALHDSQSERKVPVLSALATCALLPRFGNGLGGFEWTNAFYLAWTLPLAAWLAWGLFSGGRSYARPALRPAGLHHPPA